jgi:hypothetical protein
MPDVPRGAHAGREAAVTESPDDDRAAGYAAFDEHGPDIDVLDLQFDSVVDSPDGATSQVRRLVFAGRDCTVEAQVRGKTRPTLDVRVSVAEPVVVELFTRTDGGRAAVAWTPGQPLNRTRPELSSIFVRWPESTRRPARTAWVLI